MLPETVIKKNTQSGHIFPSFGLQARRPTQELGICAGKLCFSEVTISAPLAPALFASRSWFRPVSAASNKAKLTALCSGAVSSLVSTDPAWQHENLAGYPISGGGGAQKRHLKYRGTKISHLGNRTIIFKSAIGCGYVSFQEGKSQDSYHLLSFRAHATHRIPSRELLKRFCQAACFPKKFPQRNARPQRIAMGQKSCREMKFEDCFFAICPRWKNVKLKSKTKKAGVSSMNLDVFS